MDAPATSILPYALWSFLTFMIVALWVTAMLDIMRHRRRGTFTGVRLLCMAALISVVTVIAVAGISTVFSVRWTEAVSRATPYGIQANKLESEDPTHAYIFSFGLENAFYGSPVNSTSAKNSRNRAPR